MQASEALLSWLLHKARDSVNRAAAEVKHTHWKDFMKARVRAGWMMKRKMSTVEKRYRCLLVLFLCSLTLQKRAEITIPNIGRTENPISEM